MLKIEDAGKPWVPEPQRGKRWRTGKRIAKENPYMVLYGNSLLLGWAGSLFYIYITRGWGFPVCFTSYLEILP